MAAIELGIPYYVYNPPQTQYFALNAPADAKFCGYVTDITGLDDAGVRENAQAIVAGDGGYHGPFWRDRRPWTMSGIILPIFPLLGRDQSQELIQGILGQCMQSDGLLKWTPADGVARMLLFRKQQPVRISTGQSKVEKTFQIAAVTADYRVHSFTLHTLSVTGASNPLALSGVVNLGNATASPIFTITGPASSTIFIGNTLTPGKIISFVPGFSIAAGVSVTIDLFSTAYPRVFDSFGNNLYGSIDPLNVDWTLGVEPQATGTNGLFLQAGGGTSSSTKLQVQWRDAWL